MLHDLFGALSADLALDLGTSHTRIYVRGRGIVYCQATAVALHEDGRGRKNVIAFGDEARDMLGRTPPDIRVVQPVRDGVIVDYDVAEAMLRHIMLQVQGRRLWLSPRAAVCVPYGTSDMERRALRECAEASGAREVALVELPLAAALGAELPVEEARGHMVVDVGGGSSTVAVLSLGGVVVHHRLKVGGAHLDQAVAHAVQQRHGLLVGARSAEELKLALGGALPGGPDDELEIRGRHQREGWPRAAVVRRSEVQEALAEPVRMIVQAVLQALEQTAPELAADVAETGIVMTGGGALLRDLDRAIGEATGLPVVVPENPSCTAVLGAASMVDASMAVAPAVAK